MIHLRRKECPVLRRSLGLATVTSYRIILQNRMGKLRARTQVDQHTALFHGLIPDLVH